MSTGQTVILGEFDPTGHPFRSSLIEVYLTLPQFDITINIAFPISGAFG